VPVIKSRLRNPRFGMMAVAAAGPLTNLLLATVGAVALGLLIRAGAVPQGASGYAVGALSLFIVINIFLALFNLLPIPPFDGSHIVEGLLPARAARAYEKLRPYGFVLFFMLLLVIPVAVSAVGRHRSGGRSAGQLDRSAVPEAGCPGGRQIILPGY
jgi:Zn-dependent protease